MLTPPSLRKKYYTVHRLVAQAFIPNPENKPQINHKNFIKTDNRVENLEWVTGSENHIHMRNVNGPYSISGELNHKAKLKTNDIFEIRKLAKMGIMNKDISKIYGVSSTQIGYIIKHKSWKHIEEVQNN